MPKPLSPPPVEDSRDRQSVQDVIRPRRETSGPGNPAAAIGQRLRTWLLHRSPGSRVGMSHPPRLQSFGLPAANAGQSRRRDGRAVGAPRTADPQGLPIAPAPVEHSFDSVPILIDSRGKIAAGVDSSCPEGPRGRYVSPQAAGLAGSTQRRLLRLGPANARGTSRCGRLHPSDAPLHLIALPPTPCELASVGKIRFQSVFMSTTVQRFTDAASSATSSRPNWACRS